MIPLLLNLLSVLLVLAGLVFFLGAVVGLIRLPDFYARMHAAGKGDSLSNILVLSGLALFVLTRVSPDDFAIAQVLIPIKIMAIAVFIMLTSPTSTHALMQSGYDDGIKPYSSRSEVTPQESLDDPPESGTSTTR